MRTSGVAVRRARQADWERVRALRLASLRDAPDAFGSTYEEECEQPPPWWKQRLRGPAMTLLARVGRRDVGVAVVAPSVHGTDAAGLYAVWVAPLARGCGAGDALMEAALAAAAEAGYVRIVLDVGDHNEPARKLYARWGFAPTGRRSTLPPPRQHIAEHELARAFAETKSG